MASGFISVEPEIVRNVASQCTRIKGDLENVVSQLNSQLGELQNGLKGSAAQSFEDKFKEWVKYVTDMGNTLGTTSTTLNSIAQQADQENTELSRLAGLQGY